MSTPSNPQPAPPLDLQQFDGVDLSTLDESAAPALLAECRRLRAEVERMSVALDACTKASWWSQRDNPDAEEMANRLHRVLAACREVYLARRADERESVRLVSDSGWKKEVR